MYGLCACFMPQLNLIRSTSYTVLNREQWKRQDANLHLYSVLNTEMKINRNGIQNSLCAYFKLCCCWCCYVVVFIRFRARFPFQSISTRVLTNRWRVLYTYTHTPNSTRHIITYTTQIRFFGRVCLKCRKFPITKSNQVSAAAAAAAATSVLIGQMRFTWLKMACIELEIDLNRVFNLSSFWMVEFPELPFTSNHSLHSFSTLLKMCV